MALLHRYFTGWDEECLINPKSHETGWEKQKKKKNSLWNKLYIKKKITEYTDITICLGFVWWGFGTEGVTVTAVTPLG